MSFQALFHRIRLRVHVSKRHAGAKVCLFCVMSGLTAFVLAFYAIEQTLSEDYCICVLIGLGLLLTGLGVKLLTSRRYWLRQYLYRWTKLTLFAPRQPRRQSEILAENYLERLNDQTLFGIVILLVVAMGAVWQKDVATLVVSTIIVMLLFSQTALTELRVSRGHFGGNAAEAVELIAFIANSHNDGDAPPGVKVSRPYRPHIDMSQNNTGLVEGAGVRI